MSSKLDLSSLIYDLKCINVIKKAELTKEQLLHLTNVMDVRPCNRDDVITRLDTECEPALYLVLEGSVRLERAGMAPIVLPAGCNFGEELLKAADWLLDEGTTVTAPYTVTAAVNNCTCAVLTMKACRTVFDIDGIEKASDANISMAVKNPKKDVGKGKKANEKVKKVDKESKKGKAAKGKSKEKPSKETGAGKSKKRGVVKKKRSKEKLDDVDIDAVPSDDTTTKGKSPNDEATTSDRDKLASVDKPSVSVSSNKVTEPGSATQQTGAENEIQSSNPSIVSEQLNSPIATVEEGDRKGLEEAPPIDHNSDHATKTEMSTPPPDAPTTKAPEKEVLQRQTTQQPSVQQEVDNHFKQESDQVSRWTGKAKWGRNSETNDQVEDSQPTTECIDAEKVETASLKPQHSGGEKEKDSVKSDSVRWTGSKRGDIVRNNKLQAMWPPQKSTISSSFQPHNSLSKQSALAKDELKHNPPESKKTTTNHGVEDDATKPRVPEPIDLAARSRSPAENGDTMAPTSTLLSVGAEMNPEGQSTEENATVESPGASPEDKLLSSRGESAINKLPTTSQDSAIELSPLKTDILDNAANETPRGSIKSIASKQTSSQTEIGDESTIISPKTEKEEPTIEPHCASIQGTAPEDRLSKMEDAADTVEPRANSIQSVPHEHKEAEKKMDQHNDTKTKDQATTEEVQGASLENIAPEHGPSNAKDTADTGEPRASSIQSVAHEHKAAETITDEPDAEILSASMETIALEHSLSKSKDKAATVEPHCASRASIQTITDEHKESQKKSDKPNVEIHRDSIQYIAPECHSSGGAEAKSKLPGRENSGQESASLLKRSDDNIAHPSSSSESSRCDTGLDDSEVNPIHSNVNQQESSSSSGSSDSDSESSSSEDESSTSSSESSGKSLGDNKSSEDNLKARNVDQGISSSSEAGESENESSSDSEESSSSSESLESSSSESESTRSDSDESGSEYSWKVKPKRGNQSSSSGSESTGSVEGEESSSSSSESDKSGSGYKPEIEPQRKKRSKVSPHAHKSRNSKKDEPRNKGKDDSRTKPSHKRTDDRKTKKKSVPSHQSKSSFPENPKPVSSKCSLDSEKSKKSSKARNDLPPKVKKPKGGESKEQHKAASHKPTKETREISSFLSARKKFENRVPSQNGSGKAPRPPKNVFQRIVTLPQDYKSPVNPKSKAEVNSIRGALSKRFVFQNLPEKTTASLISAFEKKHVPAGKLVIKQGEVDDYFYIVSKGECQFEFDGVKSGEAKTGDSFGEDALVFLSPRDASVRTKADTEFFRVDQTTFRRVLQNESIKDENNKREILEKISFLQGSSADTIRKLTSIMEPVEFKKGDTLTEANSYGDSFHIITQGKVECRDVTVGNRAQKDRIVKAGKFFGKHALVEDPFLKADVVALTAGKAYKIDRKKKDNLLPTTTRDPLDARHFDAVKAFDRKGDTRLKREEMLKLSRIVRYETFAKGETIIEPDTEKEAMIYFLRKGKVHSWEGRRVMIVTPGTHFGEHVFLDAKQKKRTTGKTGPKRFTAEEECLCAIVRIQDYYEAFGDDFTLTATILSEPAPTVENKTDPKSKASKARHTVTAPDQNALPAKKKARRKIPMENLDKRVCLGEGAFGQVWLCSDKTESKPTPYVLKIMSKAHLVFEGEAEMCIREKNTMVEMSHPFIVDLVSTYNQDAFVFILLEFVQGGELFSLMNSVAGRIQLKENQAKLYALTIADAISHMHAKKFVYRDLKPENILIDQWGYAKVIDFGFAKKLAGEKTFTMCGTPGYLAPEAIASQGHDWAVDHWALGVLIYEMLSTSSPFYYDGIEELELFRSISEDTFPPIDNICSNANDLISSLLEKDPRNRLGSLANGDKDILQHAWFKGLSIAKLRSRQIEAPWKPNVNDPFDTSNFDDWSDLEDKMLDEGEPLSKKDAALFDGF